MKMKMKRDYPKSIIFLDFDGCCNSYKCGSYVTSDSEHYGFDTRIINRLKKLCEKTGAKIVLTSNWRKFEDDGSYVFKTERVNNPLPKLKKELGELYFDTIPPLRHVRKPEALREWFKTNKSFTGKFVIFEDSNLEGYQFCPEFRDNLFMCKSRFGVTQRMVDDIIRRKYL